MPWIDCGGFCHASSAKPRVFGSKPVARCQEGSGNFRNAGKIDIFSSEEMQKKKATATIRSGLSQEEESEGL
jgi:hypothetical protein